MSPISAKSAAVASGLALAVGVPVVAPAAASAASGSKVVRTYQVNVKPGVLANGSTVNARAVVRNPQASVRSWWSRRTIAKVVRKGVNGKFEMPYTSQGYLVTPTVKGQVVKFTGRIRGADVATTIRLTWKVRYAG